MKRPSDISDEVVNVAASEAAHIAEVMKAALASVKITDPDALVVALYSLILDAHSGNRSVADIVGSFALAVTQTHLDHLSVDEIPRACGTMLRFLADRMGGEQ